MTALIRPKSSAIALDHPWLDRELYPFATRHHHFEEGSISYADEGKGSPILLVHGTPSWSFEWRHAIASLRSSHRVIAPDHLGFGLSDKPSNAPYTPADHSRRLLELVRALDLRDLTLVVHDFGGPIGLPVALEEPERVRSLVIVNTWAWAHGDDKNVRRLSSFVGSPIGRFLYTWLNASPRWLVPMSFADKKKLSARVHRQYLAPFTTRHERIAPWVLGRELAGSDPFYASIWAQRAKLAEIPSTIVWGNKDPAFGKPYLAKWQKELRSAKTIELDAGHFPQEEAPERVTEAIALSPRRA
jgi:pimeloyl-ACP methyl ester carboxylesterase